MERLVEIFILIAVVWPLVGLLLEPGFTRNLGGQPSVAAKLTTFLAVDAIVIGIGVFCAPGLLHAAAFGAAVAIVWLTWRARPHYGRRRGWPPGSLALAPVGPWRDELFFQKQAGRYGPIFKMSSLTLPTVCVVGFDRAVELLRGNEHALTAPPLPFNRLLPRGFLRYMSAADHSVYRTIFRSAVSSKVIHQTEPFIIEIVRCELRRMADDCGAMPEVGIRPTPRLIEMLFAIFARLFFGVSPDSAAFLELRAIYRVIDLRSAWRTSSPKKIDALKQGTAVLQQLGFQLQQQGGPAPDSFLSEIVRTGHGSINDSAITTNLLYIMQTGWRDVSGLMCWILHMLLRHQEWSARLREAYVRADNAPSVGEQSDLATRIVRETLRLRQSEYLIRRTTAQIKLDGFVIPKGWLVRICVRESHRSAAVFNEPDAFNPDRFLHNEPSRAEYSPFGLSSKKGCLGEDATMLIGRVFANEVAQFNWKVIDDGPPEFRGFHWTPSSKWRVHLSTAK